MVSMHSGRPTCAPPCLSGVSPMLPLKQFKCWSHWRWPFLVLSGKIIEHFPFLCLSSPGYRWCDVPGLVPAGSVSSSSTLQIFRDGCFARQSICSVISFDSGMSRTVHPQDFSKVDVEDWHMPVWTSHSTFLLFVAGSLNVSVRMMACVVWLSPQ